MSAAKQHTIRYCLMACLALASSPVPCARADNSPSVLKINTQGTTVSGPLALAPLEGEAPEHTMLSTASPADVTPPEAPMQSVLMPSDVLAQIRMASDIYRKYATARPQDLTDEERQFLTQIVGLSGGSPANPHETKRYAYPQYFLELLDYHGDDDWLVQLSGVKITSKTPQDRSNVKIIAVTKDAIKLQWTPMSPSKFTDHVPNPPDPNVQVQGNQIVVTLRVHQTFTSYAMRVVEGKVTPKIITAEVGDFPDGQEVGGTPGTPTAGAPLALPGSSNDANQGINGLINKYQNGKKP